MSPLIPLFTRNNGALTVENQIANNQNNGRMGFQRGYPHNGYIPPQDMGALSQNPSQAELIGNRAKFDINTGNARGSTFAAIPNMKIGLPESLIRIGGNVMGASEQGALAGMNAGTNTYGDIMDYNRAREAEAFELEEARRADLADRMAASAEKKIGNQAELDTNISTLNEIDDLVAALQDNNMTGVIAGNVQAFLDKTGLRDSFIGDEKGATRAYFRNRLENFRVDASLAKIAQTKGAISDREMQLFLSPMPTTGATTEAVWIRHLMARRVVLQKILAANGIQTPDNPYAHNDGTKRSSGGGSWADSLDDQTKADIITHSNKP